VKLRLAEEISMQTNMKRRGQSAHKTHEGAPARRDVPIAHLKQVLNAHMLWENSFYVDGESATEALTRAVIVAANVDPLETGNVIIDARSHMNLRHAPLWAAAVYAAAGKPDARDLVKNVVQRADEMAEIIAMAVSLTSEGKLPSSVKKGVADAFCGFDEYQLGKYQGKGKDFSLVDVVRLTHPDALLAKKVVDGTLRTPDTWEVRLSSKAETKREVFEDLLERGKLGALALLRNLRGMEEAGVDRALIRAALSEANWSRVLPFRFMTAALTAPGFAPELDAAFRKAVAGGPFLKGKTAVMVDTSGSMHAPISAKSVVMRHWAGACLGAAVNGEQVDLYEWASHTRWLPRFGGLSDALSLETGRVGHGTDLGQAMRAVQTNASYDRFIVLSDMQFGQTYRPGGTAMFGRIETPKIRKHQKGYTINLAGYENPGLVRGDWTHLSGFSDKVLDWIASEEE
jgi:hypothetical protein